ncbi:MAG: DUF1134 domain-containing protein [Hyphomicrobiales bacterium]|nr:DUF1134 domain-containing protein [Hyphomicrobiales bacterium]
MNTLAYTTVAIFAFLIVSTSIGVTQARACTAEDFGTVVDDTARALRELNVDGAKRYNAKLLEYQEKHNLSQDEIRAKAAELQDERVEEFNREIEKLVNLMDNLSRTPIAQIDCAKLDQLKHVRDRMLTVMGQKSGYMLANADVALKAAPQKADQVQREAKTHRQQLAVVPPPTEAPVSSEPEYTPSYQPQPTQEQQVTTSASPQQATPQETAPPVPGAEPDFPERRPQATQEIAANTPAFEETTTENSSYLDEDVMARAEPQNLQPPAMPEELDLPAPATQDDSFTIDEIRSAGRGVFGTITAEFAGAINYAFQQYGRPNAYITGSEGGAAFLAGLRYGKGDLHLKNGQISEIYWQGPSLGTDVGAEGSSTLFLVYNLKEHDDIYGRFTGIGGSAYVAGGFGLNVLGKRGMVMVPIRTGIGLRLGASLAYLKFTERQTWNPF